MHVAQSNSCFRILVADDFKPWRDYLCSIIKSKPEMHIVAEASDGLEAVRKVEELEPDVVLLDVSMPILSGIEAAARIRGACPESKILFVSLESDPDVVTKALNDGAGYVLKSDVGTDLVPALIAVLLGNTFMSPGLGQKTQTAGVAPVLKRRSPISYKSDS